MLLNAFAVQGRFFAVINRVGRKCSVNLYQVCFFLLFVCLVLSVTIGTAAGEAPPVFMQNVALPMNYYCSLLARRCYFPCGPIGHPRVDSRSCLRGCQPLLLLPVNYNTVVMRNVKFFRVVLPATIALPRS